MFANTKHPCKEEAGDCWSGKDTHLQYSEYSGVRATFCCFQSITCVNWGLDQLHISRVGVGEV